MTKPRTCDAVIYTEPSVNYTEYCDREALPGEDYCEVHIDNPTGEPDDGWDGWEPDGF